MGHLSLRAAAVALLCSFGAWAQNTQAQQGLPLGILLPNYDRIPVGQTEGLEGGAYIARAEGTLANWYNPAGLVLQKTAQISASATTYEWATVSIQGVASGTSDTTLANRSGFFGVVIGAPFFGDNLRGGFSITQPTAWAPTINSQIVTAQGNRFTIDSVSNYTQRNISISLGWAPWKSLRLGASVGALFTDLAGNEHESLLVTTNPGGQFIRSVVVSNSATAFLATVGLQWDATRNLKIGAVFRPPAAQLFNSANVSYESVVAAGGINTNSYLRTGAADFSWKEPLRAQVGAAWVADKWAVEADLKFSGGTHTNALLSTSTPFTDTSISPQGVVTQTSRPANDVLNGFRDVVNGAVGGRFNLGPYFALHAGAFTSISPVRDSDQVVFRKLNLYGLTGGLSFSAAHVSASAGICYEFGSTQTFDFTNPSATDESAPAEVSMKSFNVLYSLSLEF
jgi:hypothetical protein